MQTTIRKVFPSMPFAHRQPNHEGHCKLIHGHNWTFAITLAAHKLDACGFVVDFGKLKQVRAWLESKFDHTLVLNATDPWLDYLTKLLNPRYGPDASRNPPTEEQFAKIVVVPDCGCEGLARYVFQTLNEHFKRVDLYGTDYIERGVRVVKVELYEDEKNSATVEEEVDVVTIVADAIKRGTVSTLRSLP